MKKFLGIIFIFLGGFVFITDTGAQILPGMTSATPSTDDRSAATTEHQNQKPPVYGSAVLPGNMGDGVSYVRDSLFPKLTNTILVTALSLSVVFLIISGVMYIISSGDGDLKDKARLGIIWSITGVAVIALSYAIVSLIIGLDFTG